MSTDIYDDGATYGADRTDALTPEREQEIRDREAAATLGPWGTYEDSGGRYDIAAGLEDTGCGFTCRRQIAQTLDEPMDNDPTHREWDEDDDQQQIAADAEFIAHARQDVPALLAEIDRLRGEQREVADEIARFGIYGSAKTAVAALVRRADELVTENTKLRAELEARPNRFTAVPAQVDKHLRTILCEDTYLRFQQTIGGHAAEEAAKDLRMTAAEMEVEGEKTTPREFRGAADQIDPIRGGGPYPSQLLCSQHNGFGPCPGAPWCQPSQDGGAS